MDSWGSSREEHNGSHLSSCSGSPGGLWLINWSCSYLADTKPPVAIALVNYVACNPQLGVYSVSYTLQFVHVNEPKEEDDGNQEYSEPEKGEDEETLPRVPIGSKPEPKDNGKEQCSRQEF